MPRPRHLAAAALALALPALLPAQRDTARTLPLDTLTVRVLGPAVVPLVAPFAVSAVGVAEIRAARPALSLGDALRAVPGVQVDDRYNFALGERISVRGFGARSQFGVRGVRVLVDGIPATLPDGQTALSHVDPAALGRAEVIRGPASALYGNASGGVIRFTSPPAPDAPLASEHRALAGAHGLRRVESGVGGRRGRTEYRAFGSWLGFDGFRAHQEATRALGGGSVAWEGARDRLRLTLGAVRWDAENPGSLSDSLLRADPSAAFARNVQQRTGERGTQAQLGASWERALGRATLDVSGHVLGRSLVNPIPNVVIDLDRRVGGARAALSGDGGGLRWTLGAEAETQHDDRRNHANEAGERGAITLDQREGVRRGAAFAQATLSPAAGVDVMAALRWDRFRFAAADRLVSAENPDDSGARWMGSLNPALGVSVAVAPSVRVYANLATAFETPTTTELANRPDGAGGFNPALDPQRTVSLEAGAKARLAGWAWLEVAAYHARVHDALIPFEVPDAAGRVFYRNAGEARHRGIEAAAVVTPRPEWTARAAYTLTGARFMRYVVDGADLSGNRVPGVAPHRLEASVLRVPARGLLLGLDLRAVSATPVADDDAEGRADAAAYTLVDARIGWEGLGRTGARVSPFLGVSNLLDRAHVGAVTVNAFGARYYEPGPRRSAYAGARVELGGS